MRAQIAVAALVVLALGTPVAAQPGPQLILTPSSGPAGTAVDAGGCGWPVGAGGAVRLTFASTAAVIGSATVDRDGCLAGTATIPADAAEGISTVRALQETTGAGASAGFTVTADAPPEPEGQGIPDPRLPGLALLEADAEDAVRVHWVDGFPAVVAARVAVEGDDPAERARSYADRYAVLYGQGHPALDLVAVHVAPSTDAAAALGGLQAVTLQQTAAGIPVLGSGLTVLLEDSVAVGAVGHHLVVDDPGMDLEPAMWPTQARLVAIQAVDGDGALGVPQLVVHDGSIRRSDRGAAPASAAELAWRVTVTRPSGSLLVVVADDDGAVLEAHHADQGAAELTVRDAGGTWTWQETGCALGSTLPLVATEDGVEPAYAGQNDAEGAFADYLAVYAQFQQLGWLSYNGLDAPLRVLIDSDTTGTAQFVASCAAMQFVAGAVVTDIVGHEFTHGVTQVEYWYESGALDESWADVMGSILDGDWLMGDRPSVPDGFRNLADPPSRPLSPTPAGPAHPDHVEDLFTELDVAVLFDADPSNDVQWDNGGVHTNSGIPNKAAYLLAEGGTHRGVFVAPLGADKVERLLFAAMRSIAGSPSFLYAASVTELLALGWSQEGTFGFTAADVCSVHNAYASVGVLDTPDSDCDGAPDAADDDLDGDGHDNAADNCPSVPNPTQRNSDGLGDGGDACDPDADEDGDLNAADNCPTVPNPDQVNNDGVGPGDACEDADGDGVLDPDDNCPETANPGQDNTDARIDDLGNACDPDLDGDTVDNTTDNCPTVANGNQTDTDGGGLGDACDAAPDDPANDYYELFLEPLLGRTVNVADPLTSLLVELCAGGCPEDWLDPGTRVTLQVAGLPDGAAVWVSDVGGAFVAGSQQLAATRQAGAATQTVRFRPSGLGRYAVNVALPAGAGPVELAVSGEISAARVVERIAGADRFATAAAVSRAAFPQGADVAYVATGGAFADALAGGPAATAEQGPVLLTSSDGVPPATADELARLAPGRVVVLGGVAAVPESVAQALGEAAGGAAVQRRAGADRYATAAAIAEVFDAADTVWVATGEAFPDALAAGAAAGGAGPVLLTRRDDVPEATAAALGRLNPQRVVVLGGEGAVGPAVVAALTASGVPEVSRAAGADRFATAVAASQLVSPGGATTVLVATGEGFADALAAAPLAAARGAPLLLVGRDAVPADVTTELSRLGAATVTVLGGAAAVGEEVVVALRG